MADAMAPDAHAARSHGDVLVRSQVIGFKKIKFFTNENVGDGKLELPENEMHTTAFWITLERPLLECASLFGQRTPERHVRLAARPGIHRHAAADVRRARPGHRDRRAPAVPGSEIEWDDAADPEAIAALAEKEFFEPNLYLYDAYPGGIGFSEPLYRAHQRAAGEDARTDRCMSLRKGLPSCVGPVGERGERAKEAALAILHRLGA